jgi:Fur family ferric uptake transcriptional regulator
MTKQKQLVQRITQSHHDHPTADEIYLEVRALDDRISRGTVYRNLDQLSDAGILSKVKVPGAIRFDSRLDYHYHMVCKICGAVYDISLPYREDLDRQVFEMTGFQVERHRTYFEGICPACKNEHHRE